MTGGTPPPGRHLSDLSIAYFRAVFFENFPQVEAFVGLELQGIEIKHQAYIFREVGKQLREILLHVPRGLEELVVPDDDQLALAAHGETVHRVGEGLDRHLLPIQENDVEGLEGPGAHLPQLGEIVPLEIALLPIEHIEPGGSPLGQILLELADGPVPGGLFIAVCHGHHLAKRMRTPSQPTWVRGMPKKSRSSSRRPLPHTRSSRGLTSLHRR